MFDSHCNYISQEIRTLDVLTLYAAVDKIFWWKKSFKTLTSLHTKLYSTQPGECNDICILHTSTSLNCLQITDSVMILIFSFHSGWYLPLHHQSN